MRRGGNTRPLVGRLLGVILAVGIALAHPFAGERSVAAPEMAQAEISAVLQQHCADMVSSADDGRERAAECPFHCALGAPALGEAPRLFALRQEAAEPLEHRPPALIAAPPLPPIPRAHAPRAPPSTI
jgi:hypothetical protein